MAYIRRLPSGKYQATVKLPGGRRTTFTHPLRKVVKRWATDTEARLGRGEQLLDREAGKVPLADWYVRWADTRTLTRHSMRSYESAWRLHIAPTLGKVPVGALTRLDVQGLLAKLSKAGVGARTQQTVLVVLSGLMRAAVDANLRWDNPVAGVRPPRHEPARPRLLTRTEADRLLDVLPDPEMAATMLYCGLRWSEAAGLTGDAVDWLRGRLAVVRVVSQDGLRDVGKSAAAHRVVPVPSWLLDRLAARLEGRDRAGFLFVSGRGRPWDYSNWMARRWRPYAPDGLTPHDLRHTYASWLVEAGVDLYRVQHLLGHSTPRMTMRYAHLAPEHFDSVLDALGAPRAHDEQSPAARDGATGL